MLTYRKVIMNTLMEMAGCLIMAFTVSNFYVNNSVAVGGATGLSLIINHFTNMPLSTLVLLVNIGLLIAGGIFVGCRFALSTLLGSIMFPLFLRIFELCPANISSGLSSVIVGGELMGVACSLIFLSGTSTGGSDTLAQIMAKLFHLPCDKTIMLFDGLILFLLAFTNGFSYVGYGLIALLFQTVTIRIITTYQPRNSQS